MLQFIVEYWIQFAFGILISISAYLFKKVKTYFLMVEQAKESVKTLLKIELINNYEFYQKKGVMSVDEKERIRVLYKEYSKLGGEGIMEEIMIKFQNILIRPCQEGD